MSPYGTAQTITTETVLIEQATVQQAPIASQKININNYDRIIDLVKDNCQQQQQHQFDDKEIRNMFYTLYSTQKQIGKGGFGVIFSGYRNKDKLPVAIKVIKKSKITQWFNVSIIEGVYTQYQTAYVLVEVHRDA